MGGNLLNAHPAESEFDFTQLAKSLDELLIALKQGNWDDLPTYETSLLPALSAAIKPGVFAEQKPSLAQLESLQKKLQQALHECILRREQIAPFISALATSNTSSQP